MPLKQTRDLMEIYGDKLINNKITDNELEQLLVTFESPFKRSKGYANPNDPISDNSFTQANGISDLVLAVGLEMSPENLHALNIRIINRAPDGGDNTFMRNSTLEKAMLAFEMNHYPEQAESHFSLPRITEAFSGENDINNLKRVILKPLIDFFQEPILVENVFTNDEFKQIFEEIKDDLLFNSYTFEKNHETLDETIRDLIHQAEVTLNKEPELINLVTQVLDNTNKFVTGKIKNKEYKVQASSLETHPSSSMKLLGWCMKMVGKVMSGLGKLFSKTLEEKGNQLKDKGSLTIEYGLSHSAGLFQAAKKIVDNKLANNSDEILDDPSSRMAL